MKQLKKMSLGELKSLSRDEMKQIMAGSGHGCSTCVYAGYTIGCYWNDQTANPATCWCISGNAC